MYLDIAIDIYLNSLPSGYTNSIIIILVIQVKNNYFIIYFYKHVSIISWVLYAPCVVVEQKLGSANLKLEHGFNLFEICVRANVSLATQLHKEGLNYTSPRLPDALCPFA